MGAPVGNFNALKHGKRSPRKRAERLAAWRAEWKERELADLAWSATNRPTDYSKILDDGGEERFMQQIRACTHD